MSVWWGVILLATTALATPYRLYWGVPLDDQTAVDIDEADLGVPESKFDSLWALAKTLDRCVAEQLTKPRPFGVAVREVRVETLDGDGNVRVRRRCTQPVAAWRHLLGEPLFDRLEDELDAHISFLRPRHQPGDPPITNKPATSVKKKKNGKPDLGQ